MEDIDITTCRTCGNPVSEAAPPAQPTPGVSRLPVTSSGSAVAAFAEEPRSGRAHAAAGTWPSSAALGLVLSCATALAYAPHPAASVSAIRLLLEAPVVWLLAVGVVVRPLRSLRSLLSVLANVSTTATATAVAEPGGGAM